MTTQLATIETSMKAIEFTSDELQFFKDKYAPNSTDMEYKWFIATAQVHGANPIKREIYFVKYGEGPNANASIIFAYQFKIKKAEAAGYYQGLTLPMFQDEEGTWWDSWPYDVKVKVPVACKIGVYRKDWPDARWAIVHWRERAKFYKDGLMAEWKNQPIHMLYKCAVSYALNLFCPEVADMVTDAEVPITPPGEGTSPTDAIEAGREAKTRVDRERRP